MNDFDFVRMNTQTTGGACSNCGQPYSPGAVHGPGICGHVPAGETRYIGITPDQVRQIVREELKRCALGKSEQR